MTQFETRYRLVNWKGEPHPTKDIYNNAKLNLGMEPKWFHINLQSISEEETNYVFVPEGYHLEAYLKESK